MNVWACGLCGEPVVFAEDDEARWGKCLCGAFVWYESKMRGSLDLGIIRDDPPGKNRLEVFWETFENVVTTEEER